MRPLGRLRSVCHHWLCWFLGDWELEHEKFVMEYDADKLPPSPCEIPKIWETTDLSDFWSAGDLDVSQSYDSVILFLSEIIVHVRFWTLKSPWTSSFVRMSWKIPLFWISQNMVQTLRHGRQFQLLRLLIRAIFGEQGFLKITSTTIKSRITVPLDLIRCWTYCPNSWA